jgi:tRNA G18 (ribose-2'-O)-methylase SpoU
VKSAEEVVSSLKHPAVAAARRSLGQVGRPAVRRATSYLADGHGLVSQAVDAGAPLERIFFCHPVEGGEEAALLARARGAGLACHLVTRGVFFRILGLGYETSVRVLAEVRRPASADLRQVAGPDACVLAGEQIQDPRNVGVLIRTADAWGLACAAFTADSADPYCRASVRSTTGSAFRVPVAIVADLPGSLARLRQDGLRIIGTSAHARLACWDADLTGPCAVVLGNESTGLSEAVRESCDLVVSIPMHAGGRSFNVTVAAGIVLYERGRQKALPGQGTRREGGSRAD